MNVAELLSAATTQNSDRVAIQFGERSLTFAEFASSVRRLAAGLPTLGLRHGDRVAMLLGNTPEFPRIYYAVVGQGYTAVPINPILKADEVVHILNDCAATVVFAATALRPLVVGIRARVTTLTHVVYVGPDPTPGERHLSALDAAGERDPVGVDPAHVAHIVYTSGTTGRPKGAMITHGNIRWMIGALTEYFEETASDVVVCALPLFHAYALLQCMLVPLSVGARMILLDRFTPDGTMRAIQGEHATVFFGVPTMYVMMLNAGLSQYDLTSLRLCVSGGASIPLEVLRRFEATAHVAICEGYGLSEMTVMCICNPPRDGLQKPGSIGLPLPGLEARVEGPDGAELPPGAAGEIAVRGPSVMLGYWRRPEATAEVLRGGWLHTGDVGRRDADGYFFVVDRVKDMYIRGGYNVYPREIEEVLYAHPAVLEAAVAGVPDPTFGEEGIAFVVLAPDQEVGPGDLIEYCRARLADYKIPKHIELRTDLPKSSTGKILKRALFVQDPRPQ